MKSLVVVEALNGTRIAGNSPSDKRNRVQEARRGDPRGPVHLVSRCDHSDVEAVESKTSRKITAIADGELCKLLLEITLADSAYQRIHS